MKHLYLILIALVTLVAATLLEMLRTLAKTLDACGCVSEATNIIKGFDSNEDIYDMREKLKESHPEYYSYKDRELKDQCEDEWENLKSVAESKGLLNQPRFSKGHTRSFERVFFMEITFLHDVSL